MNMSENTSSDNADSNELSFLFDCSLLERNASLKISRSIDLL